MKQSLFFLFFITSYVVNAAEDALKKMRDEAKVRYYQSDHYKTLQREELFQNELKERDEFFDQQHEVFNGMLHLKNINTNIVKFGEVFENEEKLKILTWLQEEWRSAGSDCLFDAWILEKNLAQTSMLGKLVEKFRAQKTSLGTLDFYHYVLMHITFKKADDYCDDWFVDMTILELLTSNLQSEDAQSFLLLAGEVFKENMELKKQLEYWKKFYIHSTSSLGIRQFFENIYTDPSVYYSFLTTVIDEELAKSLK